jgi:transcriptional regulator with XRE-family HTH domain
MRSKLNPDGTRIRILRTQRGWTQEQLAEIAGVSSRTIQRTETANCGSFETVRAIAGAFDTDFDQLLKLVPHSVSDPEPQIANPTCIPSPRPEIKPIPDESSKPSGRDRWAIPLLSISTLALGLVSGVLFTTQFSTGEKSSSQETSKIHASSRSIPGLHEPVPPGTVTQWEKPLTKAPSQSMKHANPKHTAAVAESLPYSNSAEQLSDINSTADLDSPDIIKRSQVSTSLDLPIQSHDLLSEPVILDAPVALGELQPFSIRTLKEPDLGAVRQAVDLAAKKTGTFISKVSTSLKRVF